jgi:NAD(P)-dependent dehydrogenase (short-subunit alcohol dehydrogenase family)
MKLQDKVALITGAGSGLGRVSAILFASEGASIGVADINLESAEETASEISRAGGRALALQVDVSNSVSVKQDCEEVKAETIDAALSRIEARRDKFHWNGFIILGPYPAPKSSANGQISIYYPRGLKTERLDGGPSWI